MSAIHTVDRLEDLPRPAPDADFVVVDVIISSTSIVRLLEAGARYVRPFADADRARGFKRETEEAILVGEDGGDPIEGFDLSPLPSRIADADVAGRPVGIRTSNGTRAMDRIGASEGLFVGSTVNARAVADRLRERDRDVWIVAAGRQGSPTPEDIAGAELLAAHARDEEPETDSFRRAVRSSGTAAWLREMGYSEEVEALCAFDSTGTVPVLRDGVFVPA
jgi:2-phosphosulfolactate phosphatase